MNKKVYTILDVKGRSIGPLVLATHQIVGAKSIDNRTNDIILTHR